MASADSKFDDFSCTDFDSLIDDAILKNIKKATAWGIPVLKGKVFFIQEYKINMSGLPRIQWFQ